MVVEEAAVEVAQGTAVMVAATMAVQPSVKVPVRPPAALQTFSEDYHQAPPAPLLPLLLA